MDGTMEIIKSIKNNTKSPLSLVLYLLLVWVIITNINVEYKIVNIKLTVWISIILSILGITLWLINKFNIKKNKSNLPCIAILICSDQIEKKDVEKNIFFKLLSDEFSDVFKIIIYEKDELKKFYKHNSSIHEIMSELNLTILFEVKERTGKINGEKHYELEISRTSVHFPFVPNDHYFPAFTYDVTRSINHYISISSNNSLKDSKEEISMFKLSSMYLIAIINIISPNPEKAYPILENIMCILKITNIPKEQFKYISERIPYRFIETSFNVIYKILNTEKYYNNCEILNNLDICLERHLSMIDNYYRTKMIDRRTYKNHHQNYLLQKAIVLYEKGNDKEALDTINNCDFTIKPNSSPYFSKNFLLVMNEKYEEAAVSYKKLLKRKMLDYDEVKSIMNFINCRLDLDKGNEKLLFCLSIINYYCADKEWAIKTFDYLKCSKKELVKPINIILGNNNSY